jgi:hypothetical protein
MKRQLATVLLAMVVGILGFAASGVAVAAGSEKPPSPPGQGECEHGNSEKPCKEDPQPEKGKDCELHGISGGVNEDHCKGEDTTPTDTTPIETTPTESIPTDTTPQEGVPNGGGETPSEPSDTSSESGSPQATDSNSAPVAETNSAPESTDDSSEASPEIVGTPPVAAPAKKQTAALSVTANAPKPTRQAQEAPLTL